MPTKLLLFVFVLLFVLRVTFRKEMTGRGWIKGLLGGRVLEGIEGNAGGGDCNRIGW